jgi:hypothetical protein
VLRRPLDAQAHHLSASAVNADNKTGSHGKAMGDANEADLTAAPLHIFIRR